MSCLRPRGRSPTTATGSAVDTAAEAARAGRLVTFGIAPTAPETGYGYIEAGGDRGDGVRDVARFVEKPDRARAEEMLAAGGYFWNSGMFMLGAGAFLAECEALAPEILAAARERGRQGAEPTSISSGSMQAAFADRAQHFGRLRDLREDRARRRR